MLQITRTRQHLPRLDKSTINGRFLFIKKRNYNIKFKFNIYYSYANITYGVKLQFSNPGAP